MDTVLRKQTISIFTVPPEDANSKFLWNTATQTTCYPNLHHIMFIHHCQNLKQKPSGRFMQEKLNYKHHSVFWTTAATAAGLSRSRITGHNKWLITNLGTASKKEHKYSSFCRSSQSSKRWTMKLFFQLLDLTVLNSWILLSCGAKYTHRDFRLLLVRKLIEEAEESQDHPNPRLVVTTSVGAKNVLRLESPHNKHWPAKSSTQMCCCVLLATRERVRCINAPDVMWAHSRCLVLQLSFEDLNQSMSPLKISYHYTSSVTVSSSNRHPVCASCMLPRHVLLGHLDPWRCDRLVIPKQWNGITTLCCTQPQKIAGLKTCSISVSFW